VSSSSPNPKPKRHRHKRWPAVVLDRMHARWRHLPRHVRADLFDIVQDELVQALARVMVRTDPIRKAEDLRQEELVAAVVEAMDDSAMVALLSLESLPSSPEAMRQGQQILAHAAQMLEMPWRDPP